MAWKNKPIDPDVIRLDHEAGFVSTESASLARGYPEGEVEQARKDQAMRLTLIAEAQSTGGMQNAAARGVPDADSNQDSGKDEKELSRQTDNQATTKDRTRGDAK